MKAGAVFFLCILLFTGCTGSENRMDTALSLREKMKSQGCSFVGEVTADYGASTQSFTLSCSSDAKGNVTFTVAAPESIAGITGVLDQEGGEITFDNEAVRFETLAEDKLSPICSPWILIHTLRAGYITSCGECEEGIRLSIDDSYREDALNLDIWLGENELPVAADISWKGRRVLSMTVRDFRFL